MGFSEALTYAGTLDHVLIPYELAEGMEETRRQVFLSESRGSIGILIGPEGDLRWRKWKRLWRWQELFQSLLENGFSERRQPDYLYFQSSHI